MTRPADALLSRRQRRALERSERLRDRTRTRAPLRRPVWRSPIALVSLGAVALAVVAIAALASKPPPSDGEILVPAMSYPEALVDAEAVGRGDAPVVIEVYSDFQCPVCGRFAKE